MEGNGHNERIIGQIRRSCVDHPIGSQIDDLMPVSMFKPQNQLSGDTGISNRCPTPIPGAAKRQTIITDHGSIRRTWQGRPAKITYETCDKRRLCKT